MIVTQYRPWYIQGTPAARQAAHHFFGAAAHDGEPTWTPRVDVREEPSRFVILADLPGIDPADIEVQMDSNVLTLKGERKAEPASDDARTTRSERRHGSFERRFTLPDNVDAEAIAASGKHGVLEISIPKKAQAAPRRIEIHA